MLCVHIYSSYRTDYYNDIWIIPDDLMWERYNMITVQSTERPMPPLSARTLRIAKGVHRHVRET